MVRSSRGKLGSLGGSPIIRRFVKLAAKSSSRQFASAGGLPRSYHALIGQWARSSLDRVVGPKSRWGKRRGKASDRGLISSNAVWDQLRGRRGRRDRSELCTSADNTPGGQVNTAPSARIDPQLGTCQYRARCVGVVRHLPDMRGAGRRPDSKAYDIDRSRYGRHVFTIGVSSG
jgi:hypothetical protein